MRLIFGLLLLLGGIWAVGVGFNAYNQLNKLENALGPNAAEVWGQQYANSFQEARNMSYVYLGGGALGFLIGLYVLTRRSKTQPTTVVVQQPHYQPAPAPQPVVTHSQVTTPQETVYDQLEKLGKLKEQGVLTDEEFQSEKRKILS